MRSKRNGRAGRGTLASLTGDPGDHRITMQLMEGANRDLGAVTIASYDEIVDVAQLRRFLRLPLQRQVVARMLPHRMPD